MKHTATKSPITNKPLRYPAQSLDEKIDKLINDKLLMYIIIPAIFIVTSISSWINYFNKSIPNPIVFTTITVLLIIWSSYKISKLKRELRILKQGRDGEREVGMNLELLREIGINVYHDILGDGFNIDHLLIGKQGIFTIETKTYSKPNKGICKIIFDGKKLSYNGIYYDDKPIIQSRAAASWIKNYLKSSTGRNFPVHSIVVFPGWYTETKVPVKDLWILNPKGLKKFILNSKNILTKEDISLASSRIEIYIKNTNYS